ncbi:asparagine synthetase B [Thalassotalea insulae]|uniref:asparagine synthase (glutamine-hydrolyzing) n=1 Tax=Thalassotalea insulae TaxID=2056778 RepID=A0ABQ6GS20_9GAMM|nr:asparagine synthase C-terminal domain-containing protein [Thalassotalea insulae]GLX78202.1 asparagine synthetase B [Thalassotalea insulae]
MTSITILANTAVDTVDAIEASKHYQGKELNCSIDGEISYIETDHDHIFVVGYIQDNAFNQAADRKAYFSKTEILNSVTQLNGHFSIVQVSKSDSSFTLYSNKAGGNRLYLKQTSNGWSISNKLASLKANGDRLNPTALEEEFLYRWITGEHSLISGVYQVPSGHYWTIKADSITQKHCYYTLPSVEDYQLNNGSLAELTQETKRLIISALNKMLAPGKKIAILLSGGVDSSILAALAQHAGHQLVAISHRSIEHENPELATAIKFAETLNIEHRVIDISDNEIADAFKQCALITEQAPRFQSSIILYLLFEKLQNEFSQVIYGEAADTLFGNNSLKRYLKRQQKQQKVQKLTKWLPGSKYLISRLASKSKIQKLLSDTVEDYIQETNKLAINEYTLECLKKSISLNNHNYSLQQLNSYPQHADALTNDLLKIKRFALDTDVDNHFHETGALAAHFGLELVSPFVDIDVMNFAAHLPIEQTITGEFVKPILRQIGEQFFAPELMYLAKKGFPAPHLTWLNTGLKKYVEQAVDDFIFVPAEQLDTETCWTIAALNILFTEFNIKYND